VASWARVTNTKVARMIPPISRPKTERKRTRRQIRSLPEKISTSPRLTANASRL